MNLTKKIDETLEQFEYRILKNKDTLGFNTWEEIANVLNSERRKFGLDSKSESFFRKAWNGYEKYNAVEQELELEGSELLNQLKQQRKELDLAKKQLQTEKLEQSRWLREEARDNLIIEKVQEAIGKLVALDIPDYEFFSKEKNKEYCLAFGDEHYAAEFLIHGLHGEVLNQYNPEIFEKRMWTLLRETIKLVRKDNVTKLNVYSMGDFADGVLRVGQLFSLRYGVIEGSIKYGEFISNWLNELSRECAIEFQMVNGNHTQLRMLSQPKGTFEHENTALIVEHMIKARLQDNPNFSYINNPTGMIVSDLCGFNLLGIHGECRNMERAIQEFSSVYGVPIQILIGGHLHHAESNNVGVNMDVLRVPSIIGLDEFSLKLRKTSNPGALFFIVEENKGVVQQNNIRLN